MTRHTYDAEGNLQTSTDPLGRVTRYEYDLLDRVIQVTHPDGTREQQAFDEAGNIVSHTDTTGAQTAFRYDAMTRLVGVTDALGGTLNHEYGNASGIPARSVDARGGIERGVGGPAGSLMGAAGTAFGGAIGGRPAAIRMVDVASAIDA